MLGLALWLCAVPYDLVTRHFGYALLAAGGLALASWVTPRTMVRTANRWRQAWRLVIRPSGS
jgi:hypothetical protein